MPHVRLLRCLKTTSRGLALRWENIDFRQKEMLIEAANVYDEETDSTKTFEARVIKLTSKAMETLERQKAHTFLASQHVFHDPKTGAPWAYKKITDVRSFWTATLPKIGVRYRRPYNMRHTYATIGLMSGTKPGFLAKQLGRGLRMFFTVYAKWISSSDDDLEMEKLDGMIGRTIPNVSLDRKTG
jgi:integrase